mmetsp:Transcript_13489/g.17763  ORF Transcript_13489/g.17763 Transcript_13489/m.17763 type:complete len:209 (+) Transcript_13489:113-739(+)
MIQAHTTLLYWEHKLLYLRKRDIHTQEQPSEHLQCQQNQELKVLLAAFLVLFSCILFRFALHQQRSEVEADLEQGRGFQFPRKSLRKIFFSFKKVASALGFCTTKIGIEYKLLKQVPHTSGTVSKMERVAVDCPKAFGLVLDYSFERVCDASTFRQWSKPFSRLVKPGCRVFAGIVRRRRAMLEARERSFLWNHLVHHHPQPLQIRNW